MDLLDYLLLAGIAVLLFFAARYAFRHRHSGCGGSCAGCPYHGKCGNCVRRKKK
ncbi:MAG: FeoB-associated Cys-rich membrane protein [Oscillospiraceae bacterium]|jgi:hypothetical protein|nr:FeoB-associated Cys-rich membrane protein [Oscillospiraceae bacterium]MCI1990278.1 FeoB-associated Cys-rich membrane protein [Oscillospiraceae bacterium]MCI2035488.1 FeoB-associated Cys-rich membrane protein [Oscillospiraceae bacterium]